jgi:hypothetical protein
MENQNGTEEFAKKSTEELEKMAKAYYKGFLDFVSKSKNIDAEYYETIAKPVLEKYEKIRRTYAKEIIKESGKEGAKDTILGIVFIILGIILGIWSSSRVFGPRAHYSITITDYEAVGYIGIILCVSFLIFGIFRIVRGIRYMSVK